MANKPTKDGIFIAAQNKKATHDYFILETYEAGIELYGTEVKSIRASAVNMRDSYCFIEKGEIFMSGVHISPYEKGNIFNKEPMRVRKLLLHKKEILKLFGKVGTEGVTIVPLKMYFKGSKVKVEIGLCKGKKLYDKRDSEAKKQANRDIERYAKGADKY
ncbi:MAG: SsrA-binding protein SmpB [Clostridia bacterium]|nr:SsrA-binding protein SmpB [Clostridia bacterium]